MKIRAKAVSIEFEGDDVSGVLREFVNAIDFGGSGQVEANKIDSNNDAQPGDRESVGTDLVQSVQGSRSGKRAKPSVKRSSQTAAAAAANAACVSNMADERLPRMRSESNSMSFVPGSRTAGHQTKRRTPRETEALVVGALKEKGPITVAAICKTTGVASSVVLRYVKKHGQQDPASKTWRLNS